VTVSSFRLDVAGKLFDFNKYVVILLKKHIVSPGNITIFKITYFPVVSLLIFYTMSIGAPQETYFQVFDRGWSPTR
jgi:hypothetical protein